MPPMQHPERVELKRALNLAFLTFYGLGTILGAGIYVLVSKVARLAATLGMLAFQIFTGIAG